MIWSTHLHCAAVALFAMAASYAVSAWASNFTLTADDVAALDTASF